MGSSVAGGTHYVPPALSLSWLRWLRFSPPPPTETLDHPGGGGEEGGGGEIRISVFWTTHEPQVLGVTRLESGLHNKNSVEERNSATCCYRRRKNCHKGKTKTTFCGASHPWRSVAFFGGSHDRRDRSGRSPFLRSPPPFLFKFGDITHLPLPPFKPLFGISVQLRPSHSKEPS